MSSTLSSSRRAASPLDWTTTTYYVFLLSGGQAIFFLLHLYYLTLFTLFISHSILNLPVELLTPEPYTQ